MKIKVNLFDKALINSYLRVLSVISLFCSFVLIAFKLPDALNIRIAIGVGITTLLCLIYFGMWISANRSLSASLRINNSNIDVKIGDIFKEGALKVISFNEYFDTQVDNSIVAVSTLNGKFLQSKKDDVGKIDSVIDNDTRLNGKVVEVDSSRQVGKKKRYELGTVCLYEDYILTAFSKFDKDNRAYLHMRDYVDFLLNFWNEIDIIYAGRSISIPLFGSGITRFKECNTISEQELLELIIWSFRISRVKFTYPSKVSIVIHESKKDKINFYKLKE